MTSISILLLGVLARTYFQPSAGVLAYNDLPAQAQYINQKANNVLSSVPPSTSFNGQSVSLTTSGILLGYR